MRIFVRDFVSLLFETARAVLASKRTYAVVLLTHVTPHTLLCGKTLHQNEAKISEGSCNESQSKVQTHLWTIIPGARSLFAAFVLRAMGFKF
jgi:hypothetical protein